MSKLSDMIAANRTNKRFAELEPLRALGLVTEDIEELRANSQTEYKISVTLGASVRVNEETKSSLQMAIMRVKASIIEAVFGEFRADLRELHRLLWERKYEAAARQVENLERKMFEV